MGSTSIRWPYLGLTVGEPRGRETRHRGSSEEPVVHKDIGLGRDLQVRGGQAAGVIVFVLGGPLQQ